MPGPDKSIQFMRGIIPDGSDNLKWDYDTNVMLFSRLDNAPPTTKYWYLHMEDGFQIDHYDAFWWREAFSIRTDKINSGSTISAVQGVNK